MSNVTTKQEKQLPPSDVNLEHHFLASLLFGGTDAMLKLPIDENFPELFTTEQHKAIALAMLCVLYDSKTMDLQNVLIALKANENLEQAGGAVYLADLHQSGYLSAPLQDYWDTLSALKTRRDLIKQAHAIEASAYHLGKPISEVVESAQSRVFGVSNNDQDRYELEHISAITDRVLSRDRPKGIPTGLHDLDTLIGGLYRKQVVTIAGETGMGKTHLAVALAVNVAKLPERHTVVIFSCEMPAEEITIRLLSNLSAIDSRAIQDGTLTDTEHQKVVKAIGLLNNLNIFVYEAPNPSPLEMQARIREAQLKSDTPIALVVLDYLQLLDGEGRNRDEAIAKLMRLGQKICKDFNCTFMPLAQLNREVSSGQDKRPKIRHLRESGTIEQGSNRILLLYRDEYHDPDTVDRNVCEIIVGKNRGGNTGTVKTIFWPQYSLFRSMANENK